MLMQSSSIDVTAGWIGKLFLRRTDTAKVQKRIAALNAQERDATLSEMEDVYVADFAARAAAHLQDLMVSHVSRLSDLMVADGRLTATQIQHALGVDREAHDRLDRLETLLNELSVLKAGPQTTERAA
ncbi:MAG: hypothetical protein AAFU41_16555 [Pseudomonadota bacterium]